MARVCPAGRYAFSSKGWGGEPDVVVCKVKENQARENIGVHLFNPTAFRLMGGIGDAHKHGFAVVYVHGKMPGSR